MQTTFHGGVQPFVTATLQQCQRNLWLQERFAAGKRHTAAGTGIKRFIPQDLLHQRVNIRVISTHTQRAGGANLFDQTEIFCLKLFMPNPDAVMFYADSMWKSLCAVLTSCAAYT